MKLVSTCTPSGRAGRARVGERAVRQVLVARGRNLNLILTISARGGIVYYETVVRSVTAEVMAHYFDNLSETIGEEQAVDLIMDNAPVHNGATMLCDNHRIRKLPAYSPFLNPVENAFSAVKADVKRQLDEPDMQLQIQDRDAARALGRYTIYTNPRNADTPKFRTIFPRPSAVRNKEVLLYNIIHVHV